MVEDYKKKKNKEQEIIGISLALQSELVWDSWWVCKIVGPLQAISIPLTNTKVLW